jgi:hypothetical protein
MTFHDFIVTVALGTAGLLSLVISYVLYYHREWRENVFYGFMIFAAIMIIGTFMKEALEFFT